MSVTSVNYNILLPWQSALRPFGWVNITKQEMMLTIILLLLMSVLIVISGEESMA